MVNPCAGVLEVLGVLLGAAAWLCSLATTLMSQWQIRSTEILVAESIELGLWEMCAVQELGGVECRPYESLLDLPREITVARLLMCLSMTLSLLGLLVAVPGLSCVKSCQSPDSKWAKKVSKGTGGALCMVAGVLGVVPASLFAQIVVSRFHNDPSPAVMPRWDLGEALFVGWAAGFLHFVAGVLLCASCLGSRRGGAGPALYSHPEII
uniref:Claudin n=1 Tax=Denticeps clupeoides TaxID=299321 RepID=A0AAY4CAI8_9TELE